MPGKALWQRTPGQSYRSETARIPAHRAGVKWMHMHVDAYAIISQQDGDVGDSLHREGMYAFGKWLRYDAGDHTVTISENPERWDPVKIMDKFEVEPGIYVRHPDPIRWSSNPETT